MFLSFLAGYKGYGLAMMVETMCGILSGGPFATHIRKWKCDSSVANLVSEQIIYRALLYIHSVSTIIAGNFLRGKILSNCKFF